MISFVSKVSLFKTAFNNFGLTRRVYYGTCDIVTLFSLSLSWGFVVVWWSVGSFISLFYAIPEFYIFSHRWWAYFCDGFFFLPKKHLALTTSNFIGLHPRFTYCILWRDVSLNEVGKIVAWPVACIFDKMLTEFNQHVRRKNSRSRHNWFELVLSIPEAFFFFSFVTLSLTHNSSSWLNAVHLLSEFSATRQATIFIHRPH